MIKNSDLFDYIIVGAGSAGCVLANRLTADPNVSVCLIEAGPTDRTFLPSLFINIPAGIVKLIANPKWNWMFHFNAEENVGNKQIFCPRGKVWGGTSSINGMIYNRGNPKDYNHWAALGNKGWSFAEILPYFKRSEHFEQGCSLYHAQGGELNVAPCKDPSKIDDPYIQAASALGYPINKDFNGESQLGFGYYHVTQKNGERWSTARAFLHPILKRPNLTVLSNTLTHKVILEGDQATGIEVSNKAGEIFIIKANKEVILSAGAIGSPHLLLLSGIGPKDELERQGIIVRKELPGVGENLQDHQDIVLMYHSEPAYGYGLSFSFTALWNLLKAPFQYFFKRKGAMTSCTVEAGGYMQLREGAEMPDIQLIVTPALKNQPQRIFPYGNGVCLHACVAHPKSMGKLTLNSTDPHAKPNIEGHFLTHPDDIALLLDAFKEVRRIAKTQPLAQHLKNEVVPGKEIQTDEQIEDWIRNNLGTVYHPVGTCKMGHDKMAVVDDELKVHGVKGLRVVDASIMPTLTGGNTNAPAIMIAEKAADMILGKSPLIPVVEFQTN